jgi:hypothetical protein
MTQAYVPPDAAMDSKGVFGGPGLALYAGVAGIALLVAVSAYFAGRMARPEDGAPRSSPSARVEIASNRSDSRAESRDSPRDAGDQSGAEREPVAQASSADEPAGDEVSSETAEADGDDIASLVAEASVAAAATPFEDFDMRRLHPDVVEAVEAAREARRAAQAASERARVAAFGAQSNSRGTRVITYENGDVYEGEVGPSGREGVGVYTWENAREGDYAGEFANDVMNGLGVKRWADGATYYGDRREEAREGFGVFVYADGGGYEGQWLDGAPDGLGVVWAPDGTVRAQGIWAANTLVEAWIMPPPDDG